jgi:hypothetical protein
MSAPINHPSSPLTHPEEASPMSQRPDYQAMYEAERTKFHAETMTTAFLMARIRESVDTFDRSVLSCDRCGWRGARMVFVGQGDHRELRCGHTQCEPPVAAPPRFGGGTLRLPTEDAR